MAKAATIYDVARKAGVSISTVSHTLNRPARVNEQTRQRVLEAIDELGYRPKASAMDLARKATRRIGVLAPFASYPSYLTRLAGILEEASRDEYEIVLFDQESAAAASMPLLSSLPLTNRVDGLLVLGLPLDDTLAEMLGEQQLPTVLVDSSHPSLDSVTIDDRHAGQLVGTHLLERGRRRITYVSEQQRSLDYLSQGQLRRAGVQDAMSEVGLDPHSLGHIETSIDIEGGRAAVRHAVESAALPDAFFAHDDSVAAGVLLECRERGISVPDQVAVVGFDGSEVARVLDITTVRQPLRESGRIGFRHLCELVDAGAQAADRGTGTRRNVRLDVELVQGSTS